MKKIERQQNSDILLRVNLANLDLKNGNYGDIYSDNFSLLAICIHYDLKRIEKEMVTFTFTIPSTDAPELSKWTNSCIHLAFKS